MFDLSGKTALVTGASGGIGSQIVTALHSQGASVILHGTRANKLASLQESLGERTYCLSADLSDREAATKVMETATELAGPVDILVNNAGMASSATIDEMSEDVWDTMLRVNLKGVYLCTRAVLPHMYERNYGKIINTASQLAYRGAPGFAHYTATKGAILSFTRSVALEIGKRNVRINAVAPGATMTPILASVPDEVIKAIAAGIPRGRLATPSEIAPAYVFLASDENDAFVGQCLSPNGGDAFL